MVQTAKTMTEHPEGTRPEEFLRDEDLVGFHQRRLAAALEADPEGDHAELRAAVRSARKAARQTRDALEDARLADELELQAAAAADESEVDA